MKKVLLMATVAAFFASCSNQQAAETTEAAVVSTDSTGATYNVDTTGSMLNWVATKIVGGHDGTVRVNGGSLNLKDGNIVSGSFTVNMASITNTDLTDAEANGKLVGHLKSADFFDVAKYPAGKFEISSVEIISNDPNGNTHSISGNLTIKDSTHNITFPAKVAVNGDVLTANGEVTINRLKWGIIYNSVSVSPAALLKKIGDNAIKDELKIVIALTAKKG